MSISAGTRGRNEVVFAPLYPPVGTNKRDGSGTEDFKLVAGMRVHMIGVGGCGMCGAAAVLNRRGAQVSGSDRGKSEALDRLAGMGVSEGAGTRIQGSGFRVQEGERGRQGDKATRRQGESR